MTAAIVRERTMKRAIISVLSLFIFAGVVYAENLNCKVVLRDMYTGAFSENTEPSCADAQE